MTRTMSAVLKKRGRVNPRAISCRAGASLTAAALSVTLAAPPGQAAGTGLPGTSGGGTAPPGVSGNVDTIISWASWIVFVIAIAGVLFVAVKMILQHHRGEGGQQMAGLFYVLGGAILTAAASGIIGALTTAS